MKNKLYRYIASFDHILEKYDGNLYEIQEKYINSEESCTFHPFSFLASNMDYFDLIYKCNLTYENYRILEKGKCTQRCEDDITCMYIDLRKKNINLDRNSFDTDAYASMYHYYIETYHHKPNLLDHCHRKGYHIHKLIQSTSSLPKRHTLYIKVYILTHV